MIASVPRLAAPPPAEAGWESPPWDGVPALHLAHPMGERPAHVPRTEVKVAWEPAAIHLHVRVADRYVRAVAAAHQTPVCGDSCVEFFFSPGPEPAGSYFNLEVNAGGTVLFHFNAAVRAATAAIPPADCAALVRARTLPRIVDPEITEPLLWRVVLAVPVALLARYAPATPPRPGARWRGNFYKCADDTSHPHWLTWAPVACPRPDFHRPEAFGVLAFA